MDSLGDVSSMLIDDYYMSMKQKLTNVDHKRWECMPLSMNHVEYAAKDAYAMHEIWSHIIFTQEGLCRGKLEKSKGPGETTCGEDLDGAGHENDGLLSSYLRVLITFALHYIK
ncbi:hypothetical protein D1007_31984 [Hordeum vulgare]|nr:hypothetical protein D1007_31984 [Hordeum vulgare]